MNNDNTNDGKVVAAKLIIYADEAEEYYTFISPEAYSALKGWMDFRKATTRSFSITYLLSIAVAVQFGLSTKQNHTSSTHP